MEYTPPKVEADDTYTVELVPPFNNAWLTIDASLGGTDSVCSGKADVILRSEHKIFAFYEPPAIEAITTLSLPPSRGHSKHVWLVFASVLEGLVDV